MNTDSRNACQLGRCSVRRVLHPLLSEERRFELSATGKSTNPKGEGMHTRILKIVNDINSWNIECLDTLCSWKTTITQKRDD